MQTPATTPTRYFAYVSTSYEKSVELNGTALPVVRTDYTYDAYGNVTTVTVATGTLPNGLFGSFTGDGYSKVTTNTYANDVTNWILGRLTRAVVQSTAP